jgi:hypothetical protein
MPPNYFPHVIEVTFSDALGAAFTFAPNASLVAAGASWLRSRAYRRVVLPAVQH